MPNKAIFVKDGDDWIVNHLDKTAHVSVSPTDPTQYHVYYDNEEEGVSMCVKFDTLDEALNYAENLVTKGD